MKNLKKVLALVLACVMVFGTVTMAAGSGYPDVADDAAYAEAVKTLSALNIFKGDENGNFNPDATITRAEMAKVLCTMLNTGDLATTATSFADVPASHWASGYIAYAQQLGCIDGYGNGNFGPEDPVTYVQVVKLVMATLGYTSMANEFGGYPTGYLYVAANQEVTKGAVAGNDEPAARSLVAVLVNNAMNTPVMERVTYGTDARWEVLDGGIGSGNIKREFKTLLTKQKIYKVEGSITDTYLQDTSMKDGFVDVEITKDLKIDVEDKIDATPVYETVDGTKVLTHWNKINVDASLAGDDATDYVDYVSSIYFKEAANGDIVIIRVAPKSTKNVTVVIDDLANLYDATYDINERDNDKPSIEGATLTVNGSSAAWDDEEAIDGFVLSYWGDRETDSRIKTIEIAADASIRFNGAKSTDIDDAVKEAAVVYANGRSNVQIIDDAAALVLSDYLFGTDRRGSVTFVDQNTDGKYDIIDVTTYEIAIVDSVNTNTNRINFKQPAITPKGYIALNNIVNPDLKSFSITLDGEAIDVADLEEYDVLNIITNDWGDGKAVYYDISVTRDVIEGTVTQTNFTREFIIIDGEKYESAANGLFDIDTIGTQDVKLGDAGKFYLDANGEIVRFEKSSSVSGNYAYLYSTGVGSFREPYVSLFTKDGAEVRYELSENVEINGVRAEDSDGVFTNLEVLEMYGSEISVTEEYMEVKDMFAGTGDTTPLTAIAIIEALVDDGYAFGGSIGTKNLSVSGNSNVDRFVTYKINNDSKITAIDFAFAGNAKDEFGYTGSKMSAEWKASLGRFASTQDITADAILFFIETAGTIEDYSVKTVSDLVDEGTYDIHFFAMTEFGASAAVILDSDAGLDTSSPLNIFASYTKGKIGFDNVYYVTYWNNGALVEEPMVVEDNSDTRAAIEDPDTGLNIGDAFICDYNKDGRVENIIEIFTPGTTQPSPGAGTAFDAILPTPLPEDFKIYNHTGVGAAYDNANNELFFGYVGKIASSANGVRVTLLGEEGSFQNYADPLEYAVINIPETAKVTVYNAALSDSFKLAEGTISDISASYFTKLSDGDMDLSDRTTYTDYSYALVRVYKDVVTEVIFVRYSR